MEKTQPDARDSRFFGFITTLDGRRLIEAWLCSHVSERFWYAPSSMPVWKCRIFFLSVSLSNTIRK